MELDHERAEYDLALPGDARAKLCLDRVRIPRQDLPHVFHEIEIEWVSGKPRALTQFVKRLRKSTGWRVVRISKLERALRMLGDDLPTPPETRAYRIRARQRLAEAAWIALRFRFAEFRWNEPGARAGLDPECLHDMRVAGRRMRAILRVFRGALPAPFARFARGELRRFFGAMGRLRDLDVCAAMLRARRTEFDAATTRGIESWIEIVEARREMAWTQLLRALFMKRYARFIQRMERDLAGAPPGPGTAPRADLRVGEAAPKMLRRAFRRATSAALALDSSSEEDAFHDVRIRFKKLRYAVEIFADLHPAATRKLGRKLADLQDVMGRFQDEVTLRAVLREPLESRFADPPSGPLFRARRRIESHIAENISRHQLDFLRRRRRLAARDARRLLKKD